MVDLEVASVSVDDAIAHAGDVFALPPFERLLVQHLLRRELEPARGRAACTLGELVELCDEPDPRRVWRSLGPDAALVRFALVYLTGDGPMQARTVAPDMDFWLRALDGPSAPERMLAAPTERTIAQLALGERARARIVAARAWLRATRRASATVVIHGPPGSGRGAIAGALASELGVGVLAIEGARVTSERVAAWTREIAWHGAVPTIDDADHAEPAALAALARRVPGVLFATAATPIVDRLWSDARVVHALEVEPLEPGTRAEIWRSSLASAGLDARAFDAELLASRFRFAPARIAACVTSLAADAVATTETAIALCRSVPEVRIGGLATKLATPYTYADLVVPEGVRAELDLIATWARSGDRLFAGDAVGGRARAPRGLACLFHGPPGTGKTMAAQVLAGELGLELYRIDLAQVMDKYIGETEKRLDRIFREAEAAGVILLFDEADGLFAKRTDVGEARDRYANLETGFLLQRLEDHAGLTILASNLHGNVDAAFHRRVPIVVELAAPGEPERRKIWERLLPPGELGGGDVDPALVACGLPLTGGDIRNAVFAAILLAEAEGVPLSGKHVAIAGWREMAKAGRMIDPAIFGPWAPAVVAHARMPRR